MTTLVTFAADYLIYYLNQFSEKIILSTGNTLKSEYDSIQNKLNPPKDPQSLSPNNKETAAVKNLKKKLMGRVNIEDTPFEVQEEWLRSKLNVPPHIWYSYTNEMRGKTMAAEIIKSRLETIEDFYREMEDANKK